MNSKHVLAVLGITALFVVIFIVVKKSRKSKPSQKLMAAAKRRFASGNGRVVSPISDCASCKGDAAQNGYTTSYTQYKDNHRSRGPIREGFMNVYTTDVPLFNEQFTVTGAPPLSSPFTGALEGELAQNPYDGVDGS